MAHPPSRSASARRWARVKRRFSRPQSSTSLAPPRTQGMTPAAGSHPPRGADVDHLVEAVDRRRPGSRLQIVQRYPDDHRRPRERHPITLAPEHVPAEEGQRIGLDHRDSPPIRVRRTGVRGVEAGGEHGGHVPPDRSDDRRRGLGIELRVQVHHAVTFEDAQSAPSALLLRPRRHAVGVEPRFGAEDELAHRIKLETFGCTDQHTLRLGDALRPGGHTAAIQQRDEETSRRGPERTRRERFPEERVPRGQRRTEQIAPRGRRLSHLHQTLCLPRRDTRHRGDELRRRPVAALLRQAVGAELGARLPGDAGGHVDVQCIEPALQESDRVGDVDELRAGELRGIARRPPCLVETLHRLAQPGHFRHASFYLRSAGVSKICSNECRHSAPSESAPRPKSDAGPRPFTSSHPRVHAARLS